MKKSCYGILSILLSLSLWLNPIFLTMANAENNSVIGYGPLENELGFPLMISVDQSNKIWILDALKSTVVVFSENFKALSSFSLPLSLPSSINQLDMQANADACWFLINDYIYKVSMSGSLMVEMNLKTIPSVGIKTINQFAVVNDSLFVFIDSLTNEAYLVDITKKELPPVLFFENNAVLFVKDVQSYQNGFFLLCQDFQNSPDSTSILYHFTLQGDLVRKERLVNSKLQTVAGISINSSGDCYLYNQAFQYEIYNIQFSLLHSSLVPHAEAPQYQPVLNGFLQKKALLIQPFKGVYLFDGNNQTAVITVASKESSLLMPTSVCGNHQQAVVYDAITQKLHYYYYELWKGAFKINLLQNESPFQNTIQIFQSSSTDIYVVWQGGYLRIMKVNPTNWTTSEIPIPSYIPPRSTVFIRSEDNRIFIYSWFDSILYSFTENSAEVIKMQIPKTENPYGLNNCKITIDRAGFVFLLVPSVHKVYVFDTTGSLVHYFTLLSETYFGYSDIKIFQELIAVSNYVSCKIEFYTKKGEFINSFGSKGTILYPQTISAYSEKTDSLNYPLALNTFDKKLWIADSGNSRVIILEGTENTELIKIELQIGSKSAYVNNNRIELDAPPFTENGRTLVPLRFIGEAFGATIEWDANTKKVTYLLDSTKIEVVIGSTIAVVNGEKKNLDVPPKLVNGRTFVPLRFISESFGASVIWEAATKKIYIEFSKPS